jgi:fatty acid desaturase
MGRQSLQSAESALSAARGSGFVLELPTLAVAAAVYAAFGLVTWFYHDLPLWLSAPLGCVLLAWHGSLQHETIHGHPTNSRRLNTLLGWLPLSLWISYEAYRRTHLLHHRFGGRHLTDPVRDPESYFVDAGTWLRFGRLRRALFAFRCTLIGRLLVGPALTIPMFWAHELHRLKRGALREWLRLLEHAAGAALVLVWVVGVCGIPLWIYVLCFCYPSVSLGQLRSFAEHRYDQDPARRTVVVETNAFFSLLFLNNNLHVVHHDEPGIAWYRLPEAWRLKRSALAEPPLVYRGGYVEILRRHAFRPIIPVAHPSASPLAAAPLQMADSPA